MGHRGARGLEPENTILSFKKAIELNCEYVELDVRLSKDNELVVIHDASLRRTTNGWGKISKNNYKKISNVRTKKKDQKIPTLQDVINETKGKIKLNIEIKDSLAGEKVAELIVKNKISKNTMVSSNYVKSLLIVKKNSQDIKTALIYYAYQKKWQMFFMAIYNLVFWPFVKKHILSKAKRAKVEYINLFYKFATKDHVKTIKSSGFGVIVWTVNNNKELSKLIKNGIDGYITDYPDRL